MRRILFIAVTFSLIIVFAFSLSSNTNSHRPDYSNDDYNYIAVNQCLMWISNNGLGSWDPRIRGCGFFWPKENGGTGIDAYRLSSVFLDGFLWGGIVDSQIRVNGNSYRSGLQPGKILSDGTPDDPLLEKYRVYKIRRNWENLKPGPERDAYEKDFNEWPVEDGAPWIDVNHDNIFTKGIDLPKHIGDETLWCVSNDMDPERSTFVFGALPIGFEVQTTVFAFEKFNYLGNMVFKKYKVINKGGNLVKDMFFAIYSDADLGNAGDDSVGCDTLLSLGYCYNYDNDDEGYYGLNPPAIGYQLLYGPRVESTNEDTAIYNGNYLKGHVNAEMSSFMIYINSNPNFPQYSHPDQGMLSGSIQMYQSFNGLDYYGNPFLDPNTGKTTKYCVPGDPETGIGWYEGEGWPGGQPGGQKVFNFSTGPFNFAPGDTQEVLFSIQMARGKSRVNSVTKLKEYATQLRQNFNPHFDFDIHIPSPTTSVHETDQSAIIYWETNVENFIKADVDLAFDGVEDSLYKFEGYRIWQYKNKNGTDPLLIDVCDLDNNISQISGNEIINGIRQFVVLFNSPNNGLLRSYKLTKDYINNSYLLNGKEYYFGVTAFAYCKESKEPFIESDPSIITVIPSRPSIDYTSPLENEDIITAEHINGFGDARIRIIIVDPDVLTGDKYEVTFQKVDYPVWGTQDSIAYNLVNRSSGDTLIKCDTSYIKNERYFNGSEWIWRIVEKDTLGTKVIEGFKLLISFDYADSLLTQADTKYYIKSVQEIKGPGGKELKEPIDVWNNYNSTGKWQVKAKGELHRFIWQKNKSHEGFGFVDYEIRFDAESKYYISGLAPSFFPLTANDELAEDTVPFTIWDIGQTPNDQSDDTLMVIKVLDYAAVEDGSWDPERCYPNFSYTHLANGDWEEIAAYRARGFDPNDLPNPSGRSLFTDHAFAEFAFSGELPEPGTVIRLSSVKPVTENDVFHFSTVKPDLNDKNAAKNRIDEITVFPNPFFTTDWEKRGSNKVTFTKLPDQVKVRIYALSGHLVKVLEKNDNSSWLDWDLTNDYGKPVGNGVFIAFLEMEGIGEKSIKIAVVK